MGQTGASASRSDQPGPATQTVVDNWRSNKRLAAVWDRGVKSWPVAIAYGAVVFGTDNRKMYRHMGTLAKLPAGTAVLDVPSGGGVLLRALRPHHRLRYVAADISPLMLDRVRAEAARRGLDYVEAREADAAALPFEDASFDVVASYSGLHCVPDPQAALREMYRVLRPGAALQGSVVVRGAGRLPDRFIQLWRRRRILDVVVPAAEVLGWLDTTGFTDIRTERSGAVLYFNACRPSG